MHAFRPKSEPKTPPKKTQKHQKHRGQEIRKKNPGKAKTLHFKGFGPGGGDRPEHPKAPKKTQKNTKKGPKAKGQENQKKSRAKPNTSILKGLAEILARPRRPAAQAKKHKKGENPNRPKSFWDNLGFSLRQLLALRASPASAQNTHPPRG